MRFKVPTITTSTNAIVAFINVDELETEESVTLPSRESDLRISKGEGEDGPVDGWREEDIVGIGDGASDGSAHRSPSSASRIPTFSSSTFCMEKKLSNVNKPVARAISSCTI